MTRASEPGRVGRRRTARAGFTLIELMLALTIGAFAVASVYAVGKGSTHFFHQQYRASNTMSRLRLAMARVKRDFQRAGYLATPNANDPNEFTCTPPVPPLQSAGWRLSGIMSHVIGFGTPVNGVDPASNYPNMLRTDNVLLLGNYQTSNEYKATLLNGNASTVQVDAEWYAYQHDFTLWNNGQPDNASFNQVFTVQRPVRVMTTQRRKHFAMITAVANAAGGNDPVVTIQPPVPPMCAGNVATIAPLEVIRYTVVPGVAAGSGQEWDPRETRPQLRRQEFNLTTGALMPGGENSAILDFVVTFSLDIQGTNAAGTTPDNVIWGLNNPAVAARPHDLRLAQITLGARSPGVDPTFPLNGVVDPFRRFSIDPIGAAGSRTGASRVRRLRADVFLGNMAVKN